MISTFVNVLRVPELRSKVLFTFAMLLVFRIGHWIPLPGINDQKLADSLKNVDPTTSNIAQITKFVSMFSGGALAHATIFGLGIMPYITAGIILQLLGTTVPALKKMQEEGPTGRQKIQEYTRYITVILCFFQGIGWLAYLRKQDMIYAQWMTNPMWWVMAVSLLTAGAVFLMWIGEQIDKHGIGNGASMIIMAGILAGMPSAVQSVIANFNPGASEGLGFMALALLVGGFVVVVAGSVLMTVAQRRIPIQQAKHTRGRKVYGGQKSYLPLRVNHGGVMPIVFASSLMIFPTFAFSQLYNLASNGGAAINPGFGTKLLGFLSRGFQMGEFLYLAVYVIMIYFFSYFWITVQFNPEEMSKQLKEGGSFIPGLRPGPRTAEYLETVINRITYVGAAFLAIIAVVPTVVNRSAGIDYTVTQFLGGTGLLIVVSVGMDFLQRVEANLMMRNYQGFLGGDDGSSGPRLRGPRASF